MDDGDEKSKFGSYVVHWKLAVLWPLRCIHENLQEFSKTYLIFKNFFARLGRVNFKFLAPAILMKTKCNGNRIKLKAKDGEKECEYVLIV
jgi:hypothetical protein